MSLYSGTVTGLMAFITDLMAGADSIGLPSERGVSGRLTQKRKAVVADAENAVPKRRSGNYFK